MTSSRNPAKSIVLDDYLSLLQLDARLKLWIQASRSTLVASALHALRLPHNTVFAADYVFQVVVTPCLNHGNEASNYFSVRVARAIETSGLKGRMKSTWKECARLLGIMQEGTSNTLAVILIDCPPLDIQYLPLELAHALSIVEATIEWGELLTGAI